MTVAARSPTRHRRRAILAVALTAAAAAAPAGATLRYVATSGADSGNCATSATPCRTIQYAVNQAAATGDEIRVAGGTYAGAYAGAGFKCSDLFVTALACIVNKQLTMRGGYSAADWVTSLPTVNPTRIDGENLRRVLVVERTSAATSLVLENVEIIRGYGTHRLPPNAGDALTFGFGGGIDAVNSSLTLRGVTIADCKVVGENGTGSYAGAASGGALSARASGPPAPLITLESVRFLRNVAEAGDNTGASGRGGYAHGGAIFTYFVDLVATGVLFEDNLALGGAALASNGLGSGGAHGDGLGGAMSIEFGSTVTLTDVVATGNQAIGGNASASLDTAHAGGGFGGALMIEGSPSQPSSLDVADSDLVQNLALGGNGFTGGLARGGALSSTDAPVTLERVLLIANRATGGDAPSGSGACGVGEASRGAGDGGAASLTRYLATPVDVVLRNSIVSGNEAEMGTVGCEPGGGGGGVSLQGVDAVLEHVTVAGNLVGSGSMQGSGVLLLGTPAATAALDYGIVADHLAPAGVSAVQAQSGSAVAFTRGLFAGNSDDTNTGAGGAGSFSGLTTTITGGSAGFLAPGAPGYDYRIGPGSPAVDAAVGSTQPLDFEGQTRGTARDLGADEAGSPAPIFADDFDSGDFRNWS
jgi:hypothetical protein